ncbi:hypothetical protein VSDG_01797 [Cytospora chrysosperma]|uniref:Uncharacterized protein n=1 Tax=Cytospora chrysosperma TaxID=252740 RepID=A0A423WHT7_CYTCH|nr:hypothetical protein VSDG_01797 [Valsa sordida]
MTGLNANIANGTCYIAYNQAAGSELVPCGNAGIADVPCCFGGDYCDSSNTCYDKDTGSTYLAGCTDSEYTDPACPWKSDEFADQEWVGLTRCDAINETADEWPWAGCSVPASASTAPQRLGTCGCDGKATLFIDGQALLRHASVPATAGGSISWVKGYAVTSAKATSASSTSSGLSSSSSSPSSTGATVSRSTGSAAATATGAGTGPGATSGGNSLSAGAKAGIAVGSVAAVLAVLAIAVMIFLHRRSRRKADAGGDNGGGGGDTDGYVPTGPGGPARGQAEAMQSVEDASGGVPPPAYSGFKTELPADESAMPKSLRSPSIRPGVTPEMSQSEFGDRPMSMVSELSSSATEGGERSRVGSPVYPVMASISELQG